MSLSEPIKNSLLESIYNIGTSGATIVEIEKDSKFERHTLSKYLSIMEGMGLIHHRQVGKAKLWFIDNAPLKTVLNPDTINKRKKTFAEQVLINVLSNLPIGMFVISSDYTIEYINEIMKGVYGNTNIIGDKFYEAIIGKPNPLDLELITDVINHKLEKVSLIVNDVHGNILHIRVNRMVNPNETESFILMIRNITVSKKNEDSMILNNEKLKFLLHNSEKSLRLEKSLIRKIKDHCPLGDAVCLKKIEAEKKISKIKIPYNPKNNKK